VQQVVAGRYAPRSAAEHVPRSLAVGDDYFSGLAVARQRLLWAVATRQQLGRWEPLVAEFTRGLWGQGPGLRDGAIWQAAIEHHFALVAARNLIRALDLPNGDPIPVDPALRAELIEGRDLHEHWDDNMPVFNVTPRPRQPTHRSGKDFAARNPRSGPYDWLRWSNRTGPLLLPNVSALALYDLLDAVEASAVASYPSLGQYVPPRLPSAWTIGRYGWWTTEDGHASVESD
jgi:hypothetical protein